MKQETQCPAIPAPARLGTACHFDGQVTETLTGGGYRGETAGAEKDVVEGQSSGSQCRPRR